MLINTEMTLQLPQAWMLITQLVPQLKQHPSSEGFCASAQLYRSPATSCTYYGPQVTLSSDLLTGSSG